MTSLKRTHSTGSSTYWEPSQSSMMTFKRKKYNPSKPRTVKPKMSPAMKAQIQRLIDKNIEVKRWSWAAGPQSITFYSDSTNFANWNVLDLGPSSTNSLVQGDGNSDRSGNRVRVKKVQLKLIVYPNAYDVNVNDNPQPCDVRILIMHPKATPIDLVVSSTFFDNNNTTNSPQDVLSDMQQEINKDLYVVNYDNIIKIGNANGTGTGSNANRNYFANNDYKLNHILDLDVTKFFPKNITWEDDTTTPTSFQPVLVMLPAEATGLAPTSTQYEKLKYYCEVIMHYTDA